jgi:PAS domain S-box-containing protein
MGGGQVPITHDKAMEGMAAATTPTWINRHGLSALLLLIGVAASTAAFLLMRAAAIDDSLESFASRAAEHHELLQHELDAELQVLFGVRALFDSSEFVEAEEFAQYTGKFLDRYPHIYSLEWLPRVSREERAHFEENTSRILRVDYHIREHDRQGKLVPAMERAEYWPICYLRARDGKTRLGVDAGARPENVQAMQAATRLDQPAAAHFDITASNGEKIDRAFIYIPVFAKDSGAVNGFARADIALDEMLISAQRNSFRDGIGVELLAASPGGAITRSVLSSVQPLQVADMKLDLHFFSTAAYSEYPKLIPIYSMFVAGVLASLLAAGAALQLTRRRLHLQRLMGELTAEVAERRASEHRLLLSETRYRVLVEKSPDAIIQYRDGHVIFANDAAVAMMRVKSVDDLMGKPVFDLVRPEYHELARGRMKVMLETLTASQPVEQVMNRADGTTLEVEVLSVPFKTEDGIVIQVTGRDISRRKAAEAEQQRLTAALQQSQRVDALGTLAGGIAHDFNNVLTAIIGNTHLLLDELPPSHKAAGTVREIRNASHRARELVKRISTFGRQQEQLRVPVALAPLVREIQELLRATLPATVDLMIDLPEEAPWVLGDATQIHQVLLNLCTNAWQAMVEGKGRIDVKVTSVDATQLRGAAASLYDEAQRLVCIEVRDNGVGMTPDLVEHIFEPFFTTKGPGQGSGLGLFVVHGIVQSHKGTIQVKARPGEGSAFLVYLPACDAPVEHAVPTSAEITHGNQQRVLYVDDEESLVFLVTRLLERAGYRCTGVRQPMQAIDLVSDAPDSFDLVVTDLNMPGMNGMELARVLLERWPHLPVVITTGYVRAEEAAEAKALGVRDVVLKPDTIEEIALLVRSHLDSILKVS